LGGTRVLVWRGCGWRGGGKEGAISTLADWEGRRLSIFGQPRGGKKEKERTWGQETGGRRSAWGGRGRETLQPRFFSAKEARGAQCAGNEMEGGGKGGVYIRGCFLFFRASEGKEKGGSAGWPRFRPHRKKKKKKGSAASFLGGGPSFRLGGLHFAVKGGRNYRLQTPPEEKGGGFRRLSKKRGPATLVCAQRAPLSGPEKKRKGAHHGGQCM